MATYGEAPRMSLALWAKALVASTVPAAAAASVLMSGHGIVSFDACAVDRGFQIDLRSDLNAARSSDAKSSGSSQAAKWPPRSASWK